MKTTRGKKKNKQSFIGGDVNNVHIEGINALGVLERDIMDIIWEQGGPVTVKDVCGLLRRKRREMAYTTVMMTMTRLSVKNLLKQDRTQLAYMYSPTMTREQYDNNLIEKVVERLVEASPEAVIRSVLSTVQSSVDLSSVLTGVGSF